MPIRPKIPMTIRYSATMVLSSRGMTRMRIPAIKEHQRADAELS